MSKMTNAELTEEVAKLTAERAVMLKQIKNLRKSRSHTPKSLPSDVVKIGELTEEASELIKKVNNLSLINDDLEEKVTKLQTKLEGIFKMNWFERLFLSKD